MVIEAIAASDAAFGADKLLATAQQPQAAAGFGNWFAGELNAVNDKLISADSDMQKLAVGEAQSLHEVMINLEEARLSFQLLVQVRNRLLEAYQEVMRMQV